jgi:ABC-type transporter Mla subunit MlaD
MKSKAELYAKVCLMLAWAVLPCAISWQVVYGPARFRGYLDETLAPAKEWAGKTAGQVTTLVDKTTQFADDNYPQTVATTKSTAAAVRHLDDFVVNLNANVNGGEDTEGVIKAGLIQDVHTLLGGVQGLISATQKDIATLSGAGAQTVEQLGPVLDNLAVLTTTLNKQIDKNGDQVHQTMVALEKGLVDLDTMITSEDMKSIFANVNTTTFHLGESAKSVDYAFQSLRTKMGLLKTVLSKAINIIKLTIPLP